jgi:hypothetical protein
MSEVDKASASQPSWSAFADHDGSESEAGTAYKGSFLGSRKAPFST